MKKLICNCLFLSMMFVSFGFVNDIQASVQPRECSVPQTIYYAMPGEEDISPYADDIRWVYKTINGVVYRRKYNYTKQVWLGDWEPV